MLESNVYVDGHGWFGPDYPEAGDPPPPGTPGRFSNQAAKYVPDFGTHNIYVHGHRWYGPDYPDAGEIPEIVLDDDDEYEHQPEVPPRTGAAGSKAKWLEYAAAFGVSLPENVTRDDVIAELNRRGVPTE